MTEILINDVLYVILTHLSLKDVTKFSLLNKRFLKVCRSDIGTKEIERKYNEQLAEQILDITGIKLFEIIRYDYISYLSSRQYVMFLKEVYKKTAENRYIIELLCTYFNIGTIISAYSNHVRLTKEIYNTLREFLSTNTDMIPRLRREINDLESRFYHRVFIDEIDP